MSLNELMKKLKLKVVFLLGFSIARLKRFPLLSKMATHLRLSYPRAWGAIVRKLRPFSVLYQARKLEDYDVTSFKDMAAFNEQQWKKKLLRKREYNSYLTRDGIMNNRPVVDPVVILERINRAATFHNH